MSLRDVHDVVDGWVRSGSRVAIATLISARRSAPLPPGARFAINEAGDLTGSISSGCVEGDLHERLMGLLAGAPPEVVTYGITDEMAMEVGLSCGGEIDVLLDLHDASDPAWARLSETLRTGEPGVLFTSIVPGSGGARLLVELDRRTGTLGSAGLDERAGDLSASFFSRSGSRVVELVEGDPSSLAFAESFVPPPRLAIVGATPIGEALCAMAALTGFEVAVIDPRRAFARPERFPRATTVLDGWPDEALQQLGADGRTSVVVLTHDEKLDEPALTSALTAGCGYIGLLGGRRTQAQRREALRERGFAREAVETIRGPVGLDIGARTPSEIAVSILAQLIAEGRGP